MGKTEKEPTSPVSFLLGSIQVQLLKLHIQSLPQDGKVQKDLGQEGTE